MQNKVSQVPKLKEYPKADDIPQNIEYIGQDYHMRQVWSNKKNGQGKVFIVVKNNKWYAAKLFKNQSTFEHETKYVKQLQKCKYIVQVYDCQPSIHICLTKQSPIKMAGIIMEFSEVGTLLDFFLQAYRCNNYMYKKENINKKYRLPQNILKGILCQILLGLKQIHEKGIIHRDIKTENILIDSNFRIKIIDFGLSGSIKNPFITRKFGTARYRAPQFFRYQQYCGVENDVFACGVLFFILKFLSYPFKQSYDDKGKGDDQNLQLYDNTFGKNGDSKILWIKLRLRGQKISQQLKHFFIGIFQQDRSKRLTIDEILNSPLMNNRADDSQVSKYLKSQYQKYFQQCLHSQIISEDVREKFQKLKKLKEELQRPLIQQMMEEDRYIDQPMEDQLFRQLYQKHSDTTVDIQNLPISTNMREKRAFGEEPCFIAAWIEYQLIQGIQQESLSLNKYQQISYYKVKLQEESISIQLNIIQKCQDYEGQKVQSQQILQIVGKMFLRKYDNCLLFQWEIQQGSEITGYCLIYDIKKILSELKFFQQNVVGQ